MRKNILLLLLSVGLICCCEPVENEPSLSVSSQRLSFNVNAGAGTKSSRGFDETAIDDLNIYAYRDGILDAEVYGLGANLTIDLLPQVQYVIYALANVGEVHAPARESELSSLVLSPNKMVMVLREGKSCRFDDSVSSISLELSRLYAKYILRIDRQQMENSDFEVESVRVLGEATTVQPFAGASSATSCSNGDYASETDLAALNSGEEVAFYVLENCQGVLLPDNSDPWKKSPENIPLKYRDLCSSINIAGTWSTPGASAQMNVNLMLGADNCSDFNVVRNTAVSITLSISDSGTLKSTWRIMLDDLEDERRLAFTSDETTIMQEDGWTEIPLEVYPSDMTFFSKLVSAENFETKVENGKVYAKGLYDGDQRPVDTLVVESWDGRQRDTVALTLDFTYTAFPEAEMHIPQYYGEYGTIQLPEAQEGVPIVFSSAGKEVIFSTETVGDGIGYWYDEASGVKYWFMFDEELIVFRLEKEGGSAAFDVTRYKSRSSAEFKTVYPNLFLERGQVSEGGNRLYSKDKDLYYDSTIKVYLASSEGEQLDQSHFATPQALFDTGYCGVSDLYEAFRTDYGLASFECSAKSDEMGWEVEDSAHTSEIYFYEAHNYIAEIYLYGLTEYAGKNTIYNTLANLSLTNGKVLEAHSVVTTLEAFPSQRYLGNIFNNQIAPGTYRSYSTAIDFTGSGKYIAPSPYGTSWEVKHIQGGGIYTDQTAAFDNAADDDYSECAGMSGLSMTFSEMTSQRFPACGAMALKGTLTNPHNGKSFTGYYTADVVLNVYVGCAVDFPSVESGNLVVNFVPFCEYSKAEYANLWYTHIPFELMARSSIDSKSYHIIIPKASSSSYSESTTSLILPGYNPAATLLSAKQQLTGKLSLFEFGFTTTGSYSVEAEYSLASLLLDRSGMGQRNDTLEMSDGTCGYYNLVRHYQRPGINNGILYNELEKYLLEFAYGSLDY